MVKNYVGYNGTKYSIVENKNGIFKIDFPPIIKMFRVNKVVCTNGMNKYIPFGTYKTIDEAFIAINI